MFNKATLLFFTFFASSILAVPVPGLFDNDAPTTCDKDLVTKNLAEMLQSATGIQSTNDDQLASDQDGATLTTVLSGLNAANTANTAGDFVTVASSLQTAADAINDFIGPLEGDGLESFEDRLLDDEVNETLSVAQACAKA
ncbi:hypothetical protein MVEN_01997600 [Mycena venus]|uniref:Uncharacterized protein n=1 Tax=Mycena venus TaxID=2733690 RepID=A0A8H6XES1_9AGAR|nr:hypothetical protein MVEN_01997600 [Mycena venus]